MNDFFIGLGEFLAALPTYLLNGFLFSLYWLGDHAPALVSMGSAAIITLLVDQNLQSRAMYRPGREGRITTIPNPHTAQGMTISVLVLWVLSQSGMAAPVPWIGAVMWLFGVLVLLVVHTQEALLLWNIKSGIAIYALAVIASRLYLVYTVQLSAEQWAALIGSTESAASVIATTRGNVTTIILWALWLVVPLGYFAMLLQQIFLNPMSLVNPMASVQDLLRQYRVRR